MRFIVWRSWTRTGSWEWAEDHVFPYAVLVRVVSLHAADFKEAFVGVVAGAEKDLAVDNFSVFSAPPWLS